MGVKVESMNVFNKTSETDNIRITNDLSHDIEKEVKLPYILKDKILMHPGTWNSFYYSTDSINEAYRLTNWNEENRSLFYDHIDTQSSKWVGEIRNIQQSSDGICRGDLWILDKDLAVKLHFGAKFGISPKVSGDHTDQKMNYYTYDNFSVVFKPAVKVAYINSEQTKDLEKSEVNDIKNKEGEKIMTGEEKKIVNPEGEKSPEKEVVKEEVKEEAKEARADLSFIESFLNKNPSATLSEAMAAYESSRAISKSELSESLEEFKTTILSEVKNILKEELGNLPFKPKVQKDKTSKADMEGMSRDMLGEGEKVTSKMEEPDRKSVTAEPSKVVNEMSDLEADLGFLNTLKGVQNYFKIGGISE